MKYKIREVDMKKLIVLTALIMLNFVFCLFQTGNTSLACSENNHCNIPLQSDTSNGYDAGKETVSEVKEYAQLDLNNKTCSAQIHPSGLNIVIVM